MSAPSFEEKKAEYIYYSFLAVLATRALRAILDGHRPDLEAAEALPKASNFLRDIACGAEFVATGDYPQGFDPVRAVGALDFALGPIEQLQQLFVHHQDVAKMFTEVAAAISKATDPIQQLTEQERDHLQFATYFFTAFYDSLAPLLDHPRKVEFALEARRYAAAA